MILKRNFFFIVLMATIVSAYIFVQPVVVSGTSMDPTYKDGQYLIMGKSIMKNTEYDRFEIIVFKTYTDDYPYCIKRVIGLPGETVQIENGSIYINNVKLEDKDGLNAEYAGLAAEPITLEEDEYFVLGDNRDNSLDSRYPEIGNVLKKDIIGKVW